MIYVQATHTGKGFITHEDRNNFDIRNISNDIWILDDNAESQLWIARVGGTIKTKDEAQTIIREFQVDTFRPSIAVAAITEPVLITL
jgi:hypothetical protein